MARVTVPIQSLVQNGGTVSAGTALDAANGMVIAAGSKTRGLLVYIKHSGGTAGTPGTCSVVPGADPPAFRQGLGTLVDVTPTATDRVLLVESARFAQANGDIYLDLSTGFTGTVYAYRLPNDN